MPKVSLSAARARDSEILEKLGRVQKAAESHKQQTKLHQQRHEWVEQARSLQRDARRLEDELNSTAAELGLWPEIEADVKAAADATAEVWSQVSGLRQLLAALRRRDAARLRQAPQQALELRAALGSMASALRGISPHLAHEAAAVAADCAQLRGELRRELASENAWANDRKLEDRCDLSDEEDLMLEQEEDEDYSSELAALNAHIRGTLAQLEEEMTDLRRRRAGWDDEAHFRFQHIRHQFQGRGRELLTERLRLEFPHLSREQLQQHEATCDGMKFASQRQVAAFRQWRRERLALLRRHQQRFSERRRASEVHALKKQEMLALREKGKELQGRLEVDRAKASLKREARQREEESELHRQRALQAEKDEKHRRRAQEVKQRSKEFADQRKEYQQRLQEEAVLQEQREIEARAERMARNAEVVALRQQMEELKRQEVAQKRAAMEQEQLERAAALEKAMEKLRVEAPRDPARLHKAPARLAAETYSDPLVCVTRGPNAGFDEKSLMADARYKLSAALQAAGLFGTRAGHEALARVGAPKPSQPHVVSQVFSGGYPAG